MSVTAKLKRRLHELIGPALGAMLVVYFAFHAIQGEHGLLARARIEASIDEAGARLSALQVERQRLEHRAALLMPSQVDPDLVDQQARQMLNYAHRDDLILFFGDDNPGR